MYGWIVVNAFLHSSKFSEIYSWLKAAAQRQNIRTDIYTNAELLIFNGKFADSSLKRPDFVIFWDKDIRLAQSMENMGLRLYNRAKAIEACDNKAITHSCLWGKGIAMPATIAVPMTYPAIGYTHTDFLTAAEEKLGYPFIAKECCGSFGQQVYMIKDRTAAEKLLKSCTNPLIFQEYIQSSRGKDIRINMVGSKPVAAMYRYNPKDFRANITNGGSMKKYTPTAKEIKMAQQVMKELNLDFAGVDILFGEEGPLLCEVNSNAHFKNIYDCTGINVADSIVSYIKEQQK